MSDPKTVANRFYSEVINGHDLSKIDELVSADFVEHEEFPGVSNNREGVKQFFGIFFAAFPDMRADVTHMIAEDDTVVVRAVMKGTHQGEFMGIPATGKRVEMSMVDIVRIANGQATEHWGVTDTAALMQQLGVIPA